MKITLTTSIDDLDGNPLPSQKPAADGMPKPLTLGDVILTSLTAVIPTDTATGEEKFERYALALKIHDKGAAELSADEITRIKSMIGLVWVSPIIIGRAYELLEAPTDGE